MLNRDACGCVTYVWRSQAEVCKESRFLSDHTIYHPCCDLFLYIVVMSTRDVVSCGRQRDETKMISLLVPATCRPVIDDDLCVKIAHAIDVNTSSRCDVSSKSDETSRRQFIEGA